MYYRRKILLALLEAFGGKLHNTDFQKLLFLYCKKNNQNHYDFFPYKYGCFSHISYQDKRVLIKNGYLKDSEKFELSTPHSFLKEIDHADKLRIEDFYETWKGKRGNSLVRESYLQYPHYAVKSEIINKVLSKDELKQVEKHINDSSKEMLFTIGYEGITIDEYINRLIKKNIKLVVDVRKNPLSMKYGFSKKRMSSYLENAGIKYIHIPQLGIVSELRKELETKEDYKVLFEKYASEILPKNVEYVEELIRLLKEHKRIALTCFEADHQSCHRHKITELLANDSSFKKPIVHI